MVHSLSREILAGFPEALFQVIPLPIQIPERKKTIITVLDEHVDEDKEPEAHKKLWDEIIERLRNCDEVLEGEPECQVPMRSPPPPPLI